LLGTVSGIFKTFLSLGSATVEGATSTITGRHWRGADRGPMCGLAIAIIALIPFKFFSRASCAIAIRVGIGGDERRSHGLHGEAERI